MPRYVPLEQRAAWLIEKGRAAWQEIQRLAMAEDELVDSIVLLGQELWLPHHETDGTRFGCTLRIAVHVPGGAAGRAESELQRRFGALEAAAEDERGFVRIRPEWR